MEARKNLMYRNRLPEELAPHDGVHRFMRRKGLAVRQ